MWKEYLNVSLATFGAFNWSEWQNMNPDEHEEIIEYIAKIMEKNNGRSE